MDNSVDPISERGAAREPAEPSLPGGWAYLQQVLDEALDAVRSSREVNARLSDSVNHLKHHASELEGRCEALEKRLQASLSEAAMAEDSLDIVRRERDMLSDKLARSGDITPAYEALVQHTRRHEARLRAIVDALAQLDAVTERIHAHYGPDAMLHASYSEEINLARDEALQRMRRAVEGLRLRADRPRQAQPRASTKV